MWNETSTSGRLGGMATREGKETAALIAVARARAEMDVAAKAAEDAREAFFARMVEAAKGGELISRIAKYAGWEQAYVRRQLRLRGVEPKQPTRKPPPGYKAKVETADAE